jgi:hypothetical protein
MGRTKVLKGPKEAETALDPPMLEVTPGRGESTMSSNAVAVEAQVRPRASTVPAPGRGTPTEHAATPHAHRDAAPAVNHA